MRIWVIAGIALTGSTGMTLAQDAAAGEQVFKRFCSPCHDIGPGAKIKLGPPLNAIDGRKAGTFEAFNYSPANKSSGIAWNEEAFEKYIRAPMQEMPGTRMVGIKHRGRLGLSKAIRARRREEIRSPRTSMAMTSVNRSLRARG